MKSNQECAHPACNCPAVPGSRYCGPVCESGGISRTSDCGCGHAGCKGAKAA